MNAVPQWRLDLVSATLADDGVIAYPTEGVWGLGCHPESVEAVGRILALKNRSWEMGLLMVAASTRQFDDYLEGVTAAMRAELDSAWPGPVTFLVPDNGAAPRWIVGRHATVGLRVSDHPVVRQLCERCGPLVSTSANRSRRPAALSSLDVRRYFGDQLDLLVPGNLGEHAGPSSIRNLETGEKIR